ncbi:CBM35 domain-containing protein [Microbacterium sp. RURRCA19A]|uniref:carbohydrate-binding protein n=1 Tax=Microbacterium sp. RURRCA19A TaxID=1907391 RepID=UPI00158B10FA|nr:CBM35 domain-containing protein [Microbacterium sp. RURRCA19A]
MADDIVVQLAGGTYRLADTFQLTAADSGFNGHTVTWEAAPGATPVISGATRVTGWSLVSGGAGIYQASVPAGSSTRSLFVDGHTASRARTQLPRPTFDATGVSSSNPAWDSVKSLPGAALANVELRSIGAFTDRYSRVSGLSSDGSTIVMAQPAWKNNTWGWDHMAAPFTDFGFYAENALAFLDSADEWFLDTNSNTLYYKPANGVNAEDLDIELPRLQTLMTLNGSSADSQAHNISFSGITFTGTTWNEPTVTGGYVDQQTGGYMSLRSDAYPSGGYANFEYSRPDWQLMPSAIQVAAARDVTFDSVTLTALGAGGLGIGNDAVSNLSGVGLATQNITVTNSDFFQIGANAMTIGGILQDAHHPGTLNDATGTRDPSVSDQTVANMTLSNIVVSYNSIRGAGEIYTSATGILMTYVQNSTIEHNDVVDMPYSGIATGYGWGANDAGGSSDYAGRGLYGYQPRFTTPTTSQNNTIKANYVARISTTHNDTGAIYNLSASPGTLYFQNFITDIAIADASRFIWSFYPDEGSGDLTWLQNVSNTSPTAWVRPNPYSSNISNLTGYGNWAATAPGSSYTGIGDTNYGSPGNWPCAAATVISDAGVLPAQRTAPDIATRPTSCSEPPCAAGSLCEVEAGVLTGGAAVASDHPGFTGSGFVALDAVGKQTSTLVSVPSAGTFVLTLRYTAGPDGPPAAVDRTVTVTAGGVAQVVTLPKTTSWDAWTEKSVQVVLPAGASTISVTHVAGNTGFINLDNLSFRLPAPCAAGSLCEVEAGVLTGGAAVASDHPGFTGSGFVALDAVGKQTSTLVSVPSAGTFVLTLRYTAGPDGPPAAVDRTVTVTAGGVAQVVTLPKTTSWDAWTEKSVQVVLPAGASTISVTHVAGNTGFINLDNLSFRLPAPIEPEPGGGDDGGDGSGDPTPDGGSGNPVTGGGSSASGPGGGESSGASDRGLARTGLNADGVIATAWGAFGLMVLGAGALLVRRRRSDV